MSSPPKNWKLKNPATYDLNLLNEETSRMAMVAFEA